MFLKNTKNNRRYPLLCAMQKSHEPLGERPFFWGTLFTSTALINLGLAQMTKDTGFAKSDVPFPHRHFALKSKTKSFLVESWNSPLVCTPKKDSLSHSAICCTLLLPKWRIPWVKVDKATGMRPSLPLRFILKHRLKYASYGGVLKHHRPKWLYSIGVRQKQKVFHQRLCCWPWSNRF